MILVLNCEILQALFNHVDVEKIKVIGSTYMAACGLEVHDTGRLSATSFAGGEDVECVYNFWMHDKSIEQVLININKKSGLSPLGEIMEGMQVELKMSTKEKRLWKLWLNSLRT